MAATVNLVINQGATYSKRVVWKAGSPAIPVNLSGFSAAMQIRRSLSSSTPVLTLTSAGGDIALEPSTGAITINISSEETKKLPAGRYVYDLETTGLGGEITRLMKGTATVSAEVTKL